MTTKSSAANGDTSGNNGTSPKMVPESDLIALKQSLEARIQEAQGVADSAAKQLEEATASLSKERAATIAAEAKVKGLEPQTKTLAELEGRYKVAQEKLSKLELAQLDQRRQALVSRGVDPEKAKTLDEAAIAVLELNLPAKTVIPSKGFDVKGSGGVDITGLSARELIRTGFDQLRQA